MPANNTRLVDGVVEQLERSILSGEIGPGERLLVVPIAQQFGIAQSTVRESLLILEHRGLVTVRPRRGVFVTRLSGDEAFELCQSRALIEGYAVGIGVRTLAESDLQQMREYVDVMGKLRLPRDLPILIQTDIAFHRIIAGLCGNEMMLEMWSTLNGRIGALIMSSLERKQLKITDVVRYHTDVVDALATRDPSVACREMAVHYLRGFPREAIATEALLNLELAVA